MNTRKRSGRKIKLGDIVEVPLTRGFAYVQYVYCDKKSHGDLVRVFPGKFNKRAKSLDDVVSQQDLYCCFFPVTKAVQLELVEVVGSADIPRRYRKLPASKVYFENIETGEKTWFIFDGKGQRRKTERLSTEEKKYPMRQVLSIQVLVERIENDWLPEHEAD